MIVCKAKKPIKYRGLRYAPGELLKVEDKDVQALALAGLIEVIDAPRKPEKGKPLPHPGD